MGELRQHHPNLRISKVKALQKGDLLVVGDSPQDAVILQSESKMKAALGKSIRVSKSKKDGRVLPMFQLEISDPAEAGALLSQNLMCNVTGTVYKVEEFRQPFSV